MYIAPVIVSTHSHTPDPCPKCHKPEDKITICRNCGYEYEESSDFTIWETLILIAIIIVIIIIGLITLDSILEWTTSNNTTLVSAFAKNFK